jgi:hypothetical protein
MKRLLRILFTARGLILAGTLGLAVAGSALDQRLATPVTSAASQPGAAVIALPSSHASLQFNSGASYADLWR